jgi:type IV pilus assembly protein PilO
MKLGLRELLFVGVILGLMAGSYLFKFRPDNARRLAMKAEIATKQRELGDFRRSTGQADDLSRRGNDLQRAITFFENKLPQEKEMDKILKEVWQMAEATSLQTRTIKTLKSERAAGYCEQPIQMSLSGDFNGFYSFLLQVEKLSRITRIHQMRLEKVQDHEGEVQAQLTLSIFFEPEESSGTVVRNAD